MRFDIDKGELVEGDADRAAACVPGRLKSLDASIDRSKRETAQAERAAKKEDVMRTRIYRREAKLLRERGFAEVLYRAKRGTKGARPLAPLEAWLKSEAWYNPEAVVEMALQLGVGP